MTRSLYLQPVVMECIVLEGANDVQLEPEDVTLVQVELCRASLHVRTTDAHPIEGMSLPHCYAIRIMSMEGVASYIEFYFKL